MKNDRNEYLSNYIKNRNSVSRLKLNEAFLDDRVRDFFGEHDVKMVTEDLVGYLTFLGDTDTLDFDTTSGKAKSIHGPIISQTQTHARDYYEFRGGRTYVQSLHNLVKNTIEKYYPLDRDPLNYYIVRSALYVMSESISLNYSLAKSVNVNGFTQGEYEITNIMTSIIDALYKISEDLECEENIINRPVLRHQYRYYDTIQPIPDEVPESMVNTQGLRGTYLPEHHDVILDVLGVILDFIGSLGRRSLVLQHLNTKYKLDWANMSFNNFDDPKLSSINKKIYESRLIFWQNTSTGAKCITLNGVPIYRLVDTSDLNILDIDLSDGIEISRDFIATNKKKVDFVPIIEKQSRLPITQQRIMAGQSNSTPNDIETAFIPRTATNMTQMKRLYDSAYVSTENANGSYIGGAPTASDLYKSIKATWDRNRSYGADYRYETERAEIDRVGKNALTRVNKILKNAVRAADVTESSIENSINSDVEIINNLISVGDNLELNYPDAIKILNSTSFAKKEYMSHLYPFIDFPSDRGPNAIPSHVDFYNSIFNDISDIYHLKTDLTKGGLDKDLSPQHVRVLNRAYNLDGTEGYVSSIPERGESFYSYSLYSAVEHLESAIRRYESGIKQLKSDLESIPDNKNK